MLESRVEAPTMRIEKKEEGIFPKRNPGKPLTTEAKIKKQKKANREKGKKYLCAIEGSRGKEQVPSKK